MSEAQGVVETDRWLADLKRGGTKIAILQLIREEDRYGYEVVSLLRQRTNGALSLAEGNVYPALHGLERDGLIDNYWREVEPGVPPRKYYRITTRGIAAHDHMRQAWKGYVRSLNRLLDEPNHNGGSQP